MSALDGTFQRKEFGTILKLIPMAEHVKKLHAVCATCKNKAAFTKRLGDEKEVQLIGGKDKYIAQCRKCYIGRGQKANTKT